MIVAQWLDIITFKLWWNDMKPSDTSRNIWKERRRLFLWVVLGLTLGIGPMWSNFCLAVTSFINHLGWLTVALSPIPITGFHQNRKWILPVSHIYAQSFESASWCSNLFVVTSHHKAKRKVVKDDDDRLSRLATKWKKGKKTRRRTRNIGNKRNEIDPRNNTRKRLPSRPPPT